MAVLPSGYSIGDSTDRVGGIWRDSLDHNYFGAYPYFDTYGGSYVETYTERAPTNPLFFYTSRPVLAHLPVGTDVSSFITTGPAFTIRVSMRIESTQTGQIITPRPLVDLVRRPLAPGGEVVVGPWASIWQAAGITSWPMTPVPGLYTLSADLESIPFDFLYYGVGQPFLVGMPAPGHIFPNGYDFAIRFRWFAPVDEPGLLRIYTVWALEPGDPDDPGVPSLLYKVRLNDGTWHTLGRPTGGRVAKIRSGLSTWRSEIVSSSGQAKVKLEDGTFGPGEDFGQET